MKRPTLSQLFFTFTTVIVVLLAFSTYLWSHRYELIANAISHELPSYRITSTSHGKGRLSIAVWNKDPSYQVITCRMKIATFDLVKWLLIPTTTPLRILSMHIQSDREHIEAVASGNSPKLLVETLFVSVKGITLPEHHKVNGSVAELFTVALSAPQITASGARLMPAQESLDR